MYRDKAEIKSSPVGSRAAENQEIVKLVDVTA